MADGMKFAKLPRGVFLLQKRLIGIMIYIGISIVNYNSAAFTYLSNADEVTKKSWY